MALPKVEYTDDETVITAENMNDIQDEIIYIEDTLIGNVGKLNYTVVSTF